MMTAAMPSNVVVVAEEEELKEHPHDSYENNGMVDCEINDIGSTVSDLTKLTGLFSSVTIKSEQGEQDEYMRTSRRQSASLKTPSLVAPSIKSHDGTESLSRSTTSNQVSTTTKKSLTFSTVSIRHYQRIMTENPATNRGVSIGIGWRYVQQPEVSLDRYEGQHDPLRRTCCCLVKSQAERDELLLGLGYTRPQLAATLRRITKFRNQRRQTLANLKAEKIEETFQDAGKRVKRLFGLEQHWYSGCHE